MKRIEIIANGSVRQELLGAVDEALDGEFYYSLVPLVHGRGTADWKLGTTVWPEENFLVIAYLDDELAARIPPVISALKARFPHEGVKFFQLTVD